MSGNHSIELPGDLFERLIRAAAERGVTPVDWIAANLDDERTEPLTNAGVQTAPPELLPYLRDAAARMGEEFESFLQRWVAKYGSRSTELGISSAETAAANERLFRHTTSLGYPTGSDNESIDADLAREYGSIHAITIKTSTTAVDAG